MKLANYNLDYIDGLNKTNKEKGIRNFLRKVEDSIFWFKQPATKNGFPIRKDLKQYGGIETQGYSLDVITRKGRKYEVRENGKVIKSGKMAEFSAKEVYCSLSY